ncbi:hypothetical protein Nepgr_014441 [Nepenthes gracilis]|uniref:Uncharacterized protein n=1 Tax=Nepenthes gracilis TaxID=150966 RepID=A0AAD3XQH0_NEPGR|nr:hypothetical protein Nepgr_014441 [Nepenthes gracilis]
MSNEVKERDDFSSTEKFTVRLAFCVSGRSDSSIAKFPGDNILPSSHVGKTAGKFPCIYIGVPPIVRRVQIPRFVN